ncbi:hypothetical protein K438DRAFT_1771921 [Mycena galopus ATCC 62051]|nr:hypothetical protein K438DRAFT_1771921 [Mycena galopus ATCC 62051]
MATTPSKARGIAGELPATAGLGDDPGVFWMVALRLRGFFTRFIVGGIVELGGRRIRQDVIIVTGITAEVLLQNIIHFVLRASPSTISNLHQANSSVVIRAVDSTFEVLISPDSDEDTLQPIVSWTRLHQDPIPADEPHELPLPDPVSIHVAAKILAFWQNILGDRNHRSSLQQAEPLKYRPVINIHPDNVVEVLVRIDAVHRRDTSEQTIYPIEIQTERENRFLPESAKSQLLNGTGANEFLNTARTLFPVPPGHEYETGSPDSSSVSFSWADELKHRVLPEVEVEYETDLDGSFSFDEPESRSDTGSSASLSSLSSADEEEYLAHMSTIPPTQPPRPPLVLWGPQWQVPRPPFFSTQPPGPPLIPWGPRPGFVRSGCLSQVPKVPTTFSGCRMVHLPFLQPQQYRTLYSNLKLRRPYPKQMRACSFGVY